MKFIQTFPCSHKAIISVIAFTATHHMFTHFILCLAVVIDAKTYSTRTCLLPGHAN